MKETIKLSSWFALFMGVVWTGTAALVLLGPPSIFPNHSMERILASYSKRSIHYLFAAGQEKSSLVIVDASYAAGIGEFDGVFNLAYHGAALKGTSTVLKRIREEDIPFYFLSLRDFVITNFPAEKLIDDPLARYPYILKGLLLIKMGLKPPPLLQDEANRHDLSQYTLAMCTRVLKKPRLIDTTYLKQMKTDHPRTVFVLTPILSNDERLEHAHNLLEHAMDESELPVISLSRLLGGEDFIDNLHPNEQGREKIMAFISDCATLSSNQAVRDSLGNNDNLNAGAKLL